MRLLLLLCCYGSTAAPLAAAADADAAAATTRTTRTHDAGRLVGAEGSARAAWDTQVGGIDLTEWMRAACAQGVWPQRLPIGLC